MLCGRPGKVERGALQTVHVDWQAAGKHLSLGQNGGTTASQHARLFGRFCPALQKGAHGALAGGVRDACAHT